MKNKVKPIPDTYHTATPYLTVCGADEAIDFYQRAFGANELFRMPGPNGKIVHAEILIGDSHIMLSDESAACGSQAPVTLNGTPVGIFSVRGRCGQDFPAGGEGRRERNDGAAGYVLG